MHSKEIVIRDVKPSNFHVNILSNNRKLLQLCDFSNSKFIYEGTNTHTLIDYCSIYYSSP